MAVSVRGQLWQRRGDAAVAVDGNKHGARAWETDGQEKVVEELFFGGWPWCLRCSRKRRASNDRESERMREQEREAGARFSNLARRRVGARWGRCWGMDATRRTRPRSVVHEREAFQKLSS